MIQFLNFFVENKSKFISFLNGRKPYTAVDIDDEMNFINKYIIRSDFERAKLQFKSQCYVKNKSTVIILEFIAIILFIPTILYLYLHGIYHNYNSQSKGSTGAVYFMRDIESWVVPSSLLDEFISHTSRFNKSSYYLNTSDVRFIIESYKYLPVSIFFLLKLFVKISKYHSIIDKHCPSEIFCTDESSFTNSILTLYCNKVNIKHTCIMHGEKILDIVDSFFYFNKFYCWDEHYVNLFKKLNCKVDDFIIELPASFFCCKNDSPVDCDYKIILQIPNKKSLLKLIHKLLTLNNENVVFRMHPRFKQHSAIISDNFVVEDNYNVNIFESVMRSEYVVGQFSTVLFIASFFGKKVILDDISDNKLMQSLFRREYIGFLYKFNFLSEL